MNVYLSYMYVHELYFGKKSLRKNDIPKHLFLFTSVLTDTD